MRKNIRITAKEMGFVTSNDPIQPDDTYLAERNTGPKLLTCREVVYNNFNEPSYIIPKEEFEYPYDAWECVKVEA